ncbi:sulfotransferase domain-containing protein [bacterium]|nr:sulfotransferase domain-containing protein [bacterium]
MFKQAVKKAVYPLLRSYPDFLIIGTQKAGTTSLYDYLVQHPQVVKNNTWKEVRYFDVPENYSQGIGWYLGNFPYKFQKGTRLTLDVSPSYLYFNYVPELIKRDLGDIKMIAVLRDPVERAYSAWQMYHSFATDPSISPNNRAIADTRTFAEAIAQEMDPATSTAQYPYDYIARGKYAEQLENYYRYFDKGDILVLNFDWLKEDLTFVLNSICDHLNIERFPQETIQSFAQQKSNVGKYEPKDKDSDTKTLELLREYFAPFNQRLRSLLECDFKWCA